MSLVDRLRSALHLPPRLRNRPDGMAWVKGIASGVGAEQLNGRAVKTVRLDESGLWQIEPPQPFICTDSCLFGLRRSLIVKGEVVTVTCMHDDYLEPWKADGVSDSEVRELYSPDREITRPYGRPIPVVRGTFPVGRRVIWSTDIRRDFR